jgi:RalA-binding protein 1
VDMDEESDSEESDDDAQQIIAPPEPYETDRQTVSESSDREDNYSSRRQQQPPPSFPTPQTAQSTSSYQSSQSVQPNGAASRSTTDLYSTSSSSKSYRLSKMELTLTRLKVLSSTIRPNDRGKEVWSFIISVEPRGRVAWRIEKLYSSITNLDTRVRNMLNKSQLKKIAALPESKLFKDNAPAKVDQRKAVLEHYLQSVIIAPVKDTAYICDWFCNDVQDEAKAPVSQVGYKEGYLTKRGKNFGGWKTRYFVLQGPILEYYENVSTFDPFEKDRSDCCCSAVVHISDPSTLQELRSDDSKRT